MPPVGNLAVVAHVRRATGMPRFHTFHQHKKDCHPECSEGPASSLVAAKGNNPHFSSGCRA
jgi:hypothetical protein